LHHYRIIVHHETTIAAKVTIVDRRVDGDPDDTKAQVIL
jgi:hypothetical protein